MYKYIHNYFEIYKALRQSKKERNSEYQTVNKTANSSSFFLHIPISRSMHGEYITASDLRLQMLIRERVHHPRQYFYHKTESVSIDVGHWPADLLIKNVNADLLIRDLHRSTKLSNIN